MPRNISALFFEQVAHDPDAIAFIEDDRPITYGVLADEVRRKAAWLQGRGIGLGDNVLVMVPMSVELYRTLIALFHIGATAVFVDAWAGADRIDMAAERIPISAFIGTLKAQLLRFRSPALRKIRHKIVAGGRNWRDALADDSVAADPDPDDPALITFTTGSTGVPKGAVRTHRFLATQHRELALHTRPQAGSVDLATLPIFPLGNLASGVTTLLAPIDPRRPDRFDPDEIVATMRRHAVRSTVASPAFFERLCRYMIDRGITLESFEHGFVGGAAVYPDLAESMRAAFPDAELTVLYGATEVEPISAIDVDRLLAVDRSERGLAVGRPVGSLALRILRTNPGEPLEELSPQALDAFTASVREAGEIVVSGEHVLRSYVDPSQGKGSRILVDGRHWHRTGDAGYLDDAGDLYLLGRISRRLSTAEGPLYPIEFERRIASAGLFGTVLRIDGTAVAAIEKKRDLDTPDIRQRLVDAALPFDRLDILDQIPRDPRHRSKIDYEKLTGMIARSGGS